MQRQVQVAAKKGAKMMEKEKRQHEAHVHAVNGEAICKLKHKEDVIKVSILFPI